MMYRRYFPEYKKVRKPLETKFQPISASPYRYNTKKHKKKGGAHKVKKEKKMSLFQISRIQKVHLMS